MQHTTLIVPGFHGSGPTHWQSWFEARLPDARRVIGIDWEAPVLARWAGAVRDAIDRAPGPVWVVAHSFGCLASVVAAAEVLESLQSQSDLAGRAHWVIGAMAAQMLRVSETFPDPVAETAKYTDWLAQRIGTLRAFPSSSFDVMYANYCEAAARDAQYFSIWFDELGVIVLPKEAGAATPPARFLILAGVGALALSLAGKA